MICYFCKKDTQISAKLKLFGIEGTTNFLPICVQCLNLISEEMKEKMVILEILKIEERVEQDERKEKRN